MAYQPYTELERTKNFIDPSFEFAERERRFTRELVVRLRSLVTTQVYTPVLDISHWQNDGQANGIIDFWALYDSGCRGVYIKATEAAHWTDPYFEQNWNGALETPMMVAPYHFFRGDVNGAAQAEHFIETIQPLLDATMGRILPPMGDFETNDGVTQGVYQAGAYNFLSTVKAEVKKPVMYSSAWFWNNNVGEAGWEDEFFQWAASWTGKLEPTIPYSWLRALLIYWQWCVCPKYVWCAPCPFPLTSSWDLNRYYGTEEELKVLAGYPNGEPDDVWKAIEEINTRLDALENDLGELNQHKHTTGGPI